MRTPAAERNIPSYHNQAVPVTTNGVPDGTVNVLEGIGLRFDNYDNSENYLIDAQYDLPTEKGPSIVSSTIRSMEHDHAKTCTIHSNMR